MYIQMFQYHDLFMRDQLPDMEEYWELRNFLEDLKSRVKVLVIDDVGKEHQTASGFAKSAFDLLVRTRHNKALTTIYTSNVSLRGWAHYYSDSMKNLMQRSSRVLKFQ
jgi:DNA replication protein DnaC